MTQHTVNNGNASQTSLEERVMRLYEIVYGQDARALHEPQIDYNHMGKVIGVKLVKDGLVGLQISKEDLLFDYTTRFL